MGIFSYEPLIRLPDNNGKPNGVFIDILAEIAGIENWELEYIPASFDGCMEMLRKGEVDMVPGVSHGGIEKGFYHNHEAVFSTWGQIVAAAGNDIKTLLDLKDGYLAVEKGDIYNREIRKTLERMDVECQIIEVENYEDVVRAIEQGWAGYGVVDRLYARELGSVEGVEKTDVVVSPTTLYFVAKGPKASKVIPAIDYHIEDMKNRPGTVYQKTLQKWMTEPTYAAFPEWALYALLFTGAMLGIFIIFCVVLRQQVHQKTTSLRESESKYRTLVDLLPMGMAIHRDGDVLFCNSFGAKLGGKERKPEDIVGRNLLDFITEDEREKVLKKMNSRKETDETLAQYETKLINSEKGTAPIDVFVKEIDFEGGRATQVLFMDISERKKAEEEKEDLQRKVSQLQRLEAIGTLAGGVAHDFNNILMVIMNYSDLILESMNGESPWKNEIEQILAAAERAAGLTRQLLAFSRKQVLQPVIHDMNETIDSMRKMFTRLLPENIDILIHLEEGLDRILIDPSQLEQVVMNLVVNARDAMPSGGRLDIRTYAIELAAPDRRNELPAGEYAVLEIRDNGVGMSRDVVNKIFDPFFTTKEIGKGTGLGLSTVFGIVRQSGGQIRVESKPGQGTTFFVYFPPAGDDVIEKEKERERKPTAEICMGTVLITEDEAPILELVSDGLEKSGMKVLRATSGKDAIDKAEKHDGGIDILLTDVIMPGIDGPELADRIRAKYPEIKTVFMSGYPDEHLPRMRTRAENIRFVRKPVSLMELKNTIVELMKAGTKTRSKPLV